MLTDLAIRTLPLPAKGVKRYWDKDGLCLQVSQGGAKTFYFVQGAKRQFVKLGRYPRDLSLSQARERVRAIIAKQTLGIEDGTSPVTVQDAIDRFLEKHCNAHNKPRTANETRRSPAIAARCGLTSVRVPLPSLRAATTPKCR